VQISVPNTGDLLDSATGELTGVWTDGTAGTVFCTGAGAFAAGVGLRLQWLTATIANGRRVRGATYIVPVGGSTFDDDGTLANGVVAEVQNAANALITSQAGALTIWTRPKGATPGGTASVVNSRVDDTISWLRSRRT
jgi:hypothetical protein